MGKKGAAILKQLQEAAKKEADGQIKNAMKSDKTDEEGLKANLKSVGLTVAGLKRHFERQFMMQTYLRERFSSKTNAVSLEEIRRHYEDNADKYRVEDRVKWSDVLILADSFQSRPIARRQAEAVAELLRKGEDVKAVAEKFGQADTKVRKGAGIGEKPGEIYPEFLEPKVLAMKAGDVKVVETEPGFHVVAVSERTPAGPRKLDDKLQAEIRKKLLDRAFSEEYAKLVSRLWVEMQPAIYIEK